MTIPNPKLYAVPPKPGLKENPELRAFLRALGHAEAGGVTEVCVFQGGKKPTHVGYFDDTEKAAKAIETHDGRGNNFVTLNPIKSDMLARYNNRMVKDSYQNPVERTKDNEILSDSWLLIDIDPKRPGGISATDEELDLALDVAQAIYDWLFEVGVPASAMLLAQGGSGAYVMVRLPDYEVTKENTATKKALVNFIADKFETDGVDINRKVFNPTSPVCAIGTLEMKGENLPERPHRRSKLIAIADEYLSLSEDQRAEPFDLYTLMGPITPQKTSILAGAEEHVMSKILSDGRIIEQLAGQRFAVYDPETDTFNSADSVEDGGIIYKPRDLSVDMRLPDRLTEYGTEAELDKRIEEIYFKYCDAPPVTTRIAARYVRMTYIIDCLNTIPYLRPVGEGGSGKSRFARIGSRMSYHPVETVDITKAVLFRLVDECSPTLFVDEFNPNARGGDTEGIIQVLNAGFQRGAQVYRTGEPDAEGKRSVEGYSAFGPKFLAGLKSTGSAPFESRCIEVRLEKTGKKSIRFRDTPKMYQELEEISSMLYLWRMRFLSNRSDDFEAKLDDAEDELKKLDVEPRLIQIATPLYALIENEQLKKEFADSLVKRTQVTQGEKMESEEWQIVNAVHESIYETIYDGKGEKAINMELKGDFVVGKPIDTVSTADIATRLGNYPEWKLRELGAKLTEIQFPKARLTRGNHKGRVAIVYDPETLNKIFESYELPIPKGGADGSEAG